MSKQDIVLVEYQKAQDSAEHYNTMVWTLMSVGFGFSLLILKFTLFDITTFDNNFLIVDKIALQSIFIFLGSSTLFYFVSLINGSNQKKNFKYKICQDIELSEDIFKGQNVGTDYLPFTRSDFGNAFFSCSKGILFFIFLFFSFLFLVKSLGTSYFFYSIISFFGTFIIFVTDILFNSSLKRRIHYKEVMKKIKEERVKYNTSSYAHPLKVN